MKPLQKVLAMQRGSQQRTSSKKIFKYFFGGRWGMGGLLLHLVTQSCLEAFLIRAKSPCAQWGETCKWNCHLSQWTSMAQSSPKVTQGDPPGVQGQRNKQLHGFLESAPVLWWCWWRKVTLPVKGFPKGLFPDLCQVKHSDLKWHEVVLDWVSHGHWSPSWSSRSEEAKPAARKGPLIFPGNLAFGRPSWEPAGPCSNGPPTSGFLGIPSFSWTHFPNAFFFLLPKPWFYLPNVQIVRRVYSMFTSDHCVMDFYKPACMCGSVCMCVNMTACMHLFLCVIYKYECLRTFLHFCK